MKEKSMNERKKKLAETATSDGTAHKTQELYDRAEEHARLFHQAKSDDEVKNICLQIAREELAKRKAKGRGKTGL
jgi:hypothetical protein